MREIDDVGPGRTRDHAPSGGVEIGADAAGRRQRQHGDAGTVGGAVVRDCRECVELGGSDRDRSAIAEQKVLHVDNRHAGHIARGLKRVDVRPAVDQRVITGTDQQIVSGSAVHDVDATTADQRIVTVATLEKVVATVSV